MDMRTPLARVRGFGSAHEGTDHFWLQRLTAIANIVLVLFLICTLVSLVGADHGTVKAHLGSPFIAIAMCGLILSGVVHMRLGMQVIIEDYVHGHGLKIIMLILNSFFAISIGLASLYALLKLSFGS